MYEIESFCQHAKCEHRTHLSPRVTHMPTCTKTYEVGNSEARNWRVKSSPNVETGAWNAAFETLETLNWFNPFLSALQDTIPCYITPVLTHRLSPCSTFLWRSADRWAGNTAGDLLTNYFNTVHYIFCFKISVSSYHKEQGHVQCACMCVWIKIILRQL